MKVLPKSGTFEMLTLPESGTFKWIGACFFRKSPGYNIVSIEIAISYICGHPKYLQIIKRVTSQLCTKNGIIPTLMNGPFRPWWSQVFWRKLPRFVSGRKSFARESSAPSIWQLSFFKNEDQILRVVCGGCPKGGWSITHLLPWFFVCGCFQQ